VPADRRSARRSVGAGSFGAGSFGAAAAAWSVLPGIHRVSGQRPRWLRTGRREVGGARATVPVSPLSPRMDRHLHRSHRTSSHPRPGTTRLW